MVSEYIHYTLRTIFNSGNVLIMLSHNIHMAHLCTKEAILQSDKNNMSLYFLNNNSQCSDPYINIVVEGENHCSLDTDGDGIPDFQVFLQSIDKL